ncbi:DNA replication and repair protein RecO [Cyanobacterium stanieri PCC 7202]|uniref:DNA repair protein RecO n=1 Tax=Cyanobacterium stanieri (strain ATCC 29140 / PCC 7202) TaxID=292563 RepID=K9YPF0_CYASC|nr:DNA replication and repair protein RecO [Cyanobacterium stanieri PCC 7202]
MSQTYQTIGIILKQNPFKENDLLVTIFSPEYGLIKAIAPGARKYKSSLRGRIQPLVINEFLIIKGKSLDRLIQAETKQSYPKLSLNLGKLTISQYLAEIVLNLALEEQPQNELYDSLNHHLKTLENLDNNLSLYPYLCQGIFDLLTITGIAPEVNSCLITDNPLIPNFHQSHWQVGFSFSNGGLMQLSAIHHNQKIYINAKVNALELSFIQCLCHGLLDQILPTEKYSESIVNQAWINIEKILKNYLEFYLGHSLKSAAMIDFALNYQSPIPS